MADAEGREEGRVTITGRWACVAMAWFVLASSAQSKKKPRTPSQPDISYGCIMITDIYSQALSFTRNPGLEAIVRSGCDSSVMFILTIAYFDRSGTQFGSSAQIGTVAPGANFAVYHKASVEGADRRRLQLLKIISVSTFNER